MRRREPVDLARAFLERGRQDARAAEVLDAAADQPDWLIGFHAQQAVEKFLKAVLVLNEVNPGRTHNLDELLVLLGDIGLAPPPFADRLGRLTVFAVRQRYPETASDERMPRRQTLDVVAGVEGWCAGIVGE